MPHIIILTKEKLNCVAKRFGALSAMIDTLIAACDAAEAIVQAELNGAEVSPLHAQLHAVQMLATELCDAENVVEGDASAQIQSATEALNELM